MNPIKNKKEGRLPASNKTTNNGRPTDPDYFKKYYTEKIKKKKEFGVVTFAIEMLYEISFRSIKEQFFKLFNFSL